MKKRLKKIIYLTSPKNIAAEVRKMGFDKNPISTIITYYLIFAAVSVITFVLYKLPFIYIPMFVATGIIAVPLLVINAYRKIYEKTKFADVSQYIEQMLYSFDENKKILKSLQDVKPLFENSRMGDAINKAIEDVQRYGNKVALENFEKKYDCQKINQMHKFMLEVEQTGGNFHNSVNLLLAERKDWNERTLLFKRSKDNMRITIFASILCSFLICGMMIRILPDDVKIADVFITQISTVLLFIVDTVLFYIADNKCSQSILNDLVVRKDKDVKRNYEYVVSYDPKLEFSKNIKAIFIPVVLFIGGIALFGVSGSNVIGGIPIVLGVIMFFRVLFYGKIKYRKALKNTIDEINLQFPRWLIKMALLVQSNSIQVALYKSIPEAAPVLQPELIALHNALRDNPTSNAPYINFMKRFNLPEITASMKMFYAISAGVGSDVSRQIDNIISRNTALLDKAEKDANDKFLAGMQVLFFTPQITSSIKMLIDMSMFMLMFFAKTMAF